MNDVEQYQEVHFDQYCETCKYKDTPETECPCTECLDEPVNLYSHKPVRWVENTQTK